MTTQMNRNYRTVASALAAVVIVGLSGLTLDRGHEGALPAGTIEIGELQTLAVGELNIAMLPAVEVTGSRSMQLADIDAANADTQG